MLQNALKAPVLAMIAKQYGNPKKIFADVAAKKVTVFKYDGTQEEDNTGFTDRIEKVAKAFGFKVIEKIGIEFETSQIVIAGTDRNDKPKLLKF